MSTELIVVSNTNLMTFYNEGGHTGMTYFFLQINGRFSHD